MWQEDLYQPLTDEDALKAMDEYAARTLAKKEADEAAAQASTAAAQAEISLSAIKAAMYEKYRADVNTTSNTTSAAGETMKLTFEDVRLAGIKVQDTLNLVKATSQSIEEETRTYWAKIATNIVNAAKGTSDLTADIANAIEVMKKSGVFELFGTLGKITPAGAPGPSPTPGRGPSRSQGLIAAMVALQQLGDPYVWGAEGPDAFDCSGLVKYSWGKAGKALPRVTWDMEKAATMIPAAAGAMYKWLAGIPGAMLFNASGSHMGMSIGGGKSIEAPRPGDVVKITDASKWAWAAWPLKSGGQIMRDNFPALLHRKEVVVNAPIVDKIEKAATTPPLQYNDNSTLIVQGTGMSETQIKGVLNDWEKEKQGRVANELKRYRR
jgi:cell wall-associated NlpC family hydrolase